MASSFKSDGRKEVKIMEGESENLNEVIKARQEYMDNELRLLAEINELKKEMRKNFEKGMKAGFEEAKNNIKPEDKNKIIMIIEQYNNNSLTIGMGIGEKTKREFIKTYTGYGRFITQQAQFYCENYYGEYDVGKWGCGFRDVRFVGFLNNENAGAIQKLLKYVSTAQQFRTFASYIKKKNNVKDEGMTFSMMKNALPEYIAVMNLL